MMVEKKNENDHEICTKSSDMASKMENDHLTMFSACSAWRLTTESVIMSERLGSFHTRVRMLGKQM
jgi:hypothetical protein